MLPLSFITWFSCQRIILAVRRGFGSYIFIYSDVEEKPDALLSPIEAGLAGKAWIRIFCRRLGMELVPATESDHGKPNRHQKGRNHQV